LGVGFDTTGDEIDESVGVLLGEVAL